MSKLAEVFESILRPGPFGLFIGILLVLSVPIFVHFVIHRSSGLASLPAILLMGPSEAGKTSLVTLFECGQHAPTHTSQTPLAVECSLPIETATKSSRSRSTNEASTKVNKKFLLIDTPGHGKLRYHALDSITNPRNLRGIVFVVDAANLSSGDEGLRQASEYLHDTLILLQKRMSSSKSFKAADEISVLIAANKMDLFTARPAALVKDTLEVELTKIRNSRSKGLLDSGIGMGNAVEVEEHDDWLGEISSLEFRFKQMEEFNILIDVMGGNIIGTDGPEVDKWWSWIGQQL